MRPQQYIRWTVLLALLIALSAMGFQIARADCLSVQLRVWHEDQPNPDRPLGPKYCVVPTPWDETIIESEDYPTWDIVPSGSPNGAGFTVWVPAP